MLILVGAVAANTAAAQPRKDSRWYGGIGLGGSAYDSDLVKSRADLESTGATAFTINANKNDAAFKAYLGYRLTPTVSIEGGWWNFGRTRYDAFITAPVTAQVTRRFRAHGLGASALYWYQVADRFSVFGRVGAVRVSARASELETPPGLTPKDKDRERTWNPLYGVGAEFRISDTIALRAEYEKVARVGNPNRFGTADIHVTTVGLRYSF